MSPSYILKLTSSHDVTSQMISLSDFYTIFTIFKLPSFYKSGS